MKSLLLFCLLISFSARAQKNCQLKLDKDSIKVYTCNAENSKYNSIKSKFYLNATQHQLKSMLFDVAHLGDWQDQTVSVKLLKKINENEVIYHTEVKAPVVSNRDFVIRLIYQQINAHEMKVTLTSIPDYIPKEKNVVRVPMSKAVWIVKEERPGRLFVQYSLEIDLGGTLPVWVINSLSHKAPYETFKSMKEKIGKYK
jgi:START domain